MMSRTENDVIRRFPGHGSLLIHVSRPSRIIHKVIGVFLWIMDFGRLGTFQAGSNVTAQQCDYYFLLKLKIRFS